MSCGARCVCASRTSGESETVIEGTTTPRRVQLDSDKDGRHTVVGPVIHDAGMLEAAMPLSFFATVHEKQARDANGLLKILE